VKKIDRLLERLFKFFASLKLAVIIISSLAIISAVGTIVEARYDALYAQKIIYHSPVMYLIMALLVVNLFNVMIDRLPWKKHHLGFILAHIGIIVLIAGSVVTRVFGIDGSISFDIGQSNRYALIPAETEFSIYATFGSGGYNLMHQTRRDFLLEDPKENPIEFGLGSKTVKVKDYYHFAQRKESIEPSDKKTDGPAIRFQLQNDNVNVTEWLLRDRKNPFDAVEFGPARVLLTEMKPFYHGKNELVLRPLEDGRSLEYTVFTVSKGGITKQGKVQAGDVVDLGWMGLQFRLLRYLPEAKRQVEYIKVERPSDLTSPALSFEFDGQDYWLGLNSSIRLFDKDQMFLVTYGNRRVDVGFDIKLERFSVGRYQGTMRAASYASDVSIPGVGEFHISMNNPLKHKGFTFYQASFQENEAGEPTASILSVNKDPGRWIKYLGSFLIVLGSIVMFYFKRRAQKAAKLQEA
jgi:hypothetical protein